MLPKLAYAQNFYDFFEEENNKFPLLVHECQSVKPQGLCGLKIPVWLTSVLGCH